MEYFIGIFFIEKLIIVCYYYNINYIKNNMRGASMVNFEGTYVENKLEKYFSVLRDIAFLSFEEYKSICVEKLTPYSPLTRANMIRDHFKKKVIEIKFI